MTRAIPFSGICFPDAAVSASGTADVSMLVMIEHSTNGSAPTNIQYFGRFSKAEGARTFSSLCGSGSALSAGTYDAVLLHSSGTASITIHAASLAGRVTFTPRGHSRAVIAALTDAAATNAVAGGVLGSHGAQRVLRGQGLIADAGWVQQGKNAALQTAGDCIVAQSPAPVPAEVAYAPGCPAGDSGSSLPGPAGAGQQYIGGALSNIAPGTYADSVYYANSGRVTAAGAIGAWVPFSD